MFGSGTQAGGEGLDLRPSDPEARTHKASTEGLVMRKGGLGSISEEAEDMHKIGFERASHACPPCL